MQQCHVNIVGQYTCTCNTGYSGDGVTCSDMNECAVDIHNCDANAVCTNTVGSYTCTCNTGYSGDGVTCSAMEVLSCGAIPDFGPHVNVSNYNGDNTIGSSFIYTCTPCTYFVDINVNSYSIVCQADGTWSTPTCVSASNVGHLVDGTPVPAGALGCWTASCGGYVTGGFRMNGATDGCYCDEVCCGYGDCCYDFSCID